MARRVSRAGARPASPRQLEARAEILEAAAAAMAEHGYHGMSMRDLARATGRALANFYNYFGSKEDLLFALQTHAFETLIGTVRTALEGVEPAAARLYVLVYNHVRYVAEHRSVMRVLIHEAAALPAARRKTVRALKDRYFRIGRDITAAILAQGCGTQGAAGAPSIDEAELERATYNLFGMLNWSYGWYDPRRHGSPHSVARTIHRLLLCGLVAHCPFGPVQAEMQLHLEAFSAPPLIPAGSGAAKGSASWPH